MAVTEGDLTLSNNTDPSMTFSTTLDSSNSAKLDITREELEKKQLLHTVQLLKLELSQKALVIDSLRTEQATHVEELRDKVADLQHEKKLLQIRLRSATQVHKQELHQLQATVDHLEKEKEEMTRRAQVDVEEREGAWDEVREVVREALHQPLLSEEEYLALRGGGGGEEGEEEGGGDRVEGSGELQLTNYIKARCYELTHPLVREREQLEGVVRELTTELRGKEQEMATARETEAALSSQLQHSRAQSQQLSQQLASLQTQIQDGNYKIDNFDHLLRERDAMRAEAGQLGLAVNQLEGTLKTTMEERDAARREVSSLQQNTALLQQDKDYLSRQVSELGSREAAVVSREEVLSRQLAESQAARQKLYQECVQIRERDRVESEGRLQRELDSLRVQTAAELEEVRNKTRELYERENRAVMEGYNRAIVERDRAVEGEREVNRKYEQLLQEHHKLRSQLEGRASELQATLQMKTYECKHSHMIQDTLGRDLQESRLEAEKLQKKVALLTEELSCVRGEGGERVRVLEGRVREQAERLATYEQVEKEMDDIVMQAAQAESESDAERVLFSYGFGAHVPTTSKRRAQQSVQLARRVLQLERINSALRKDIELERTQTQQLQEELTEARSLLSLCKQPQSCLVETLRARQEEARTHRERAAELQKELGSVKREKAQLEETRSQMAADLERLLNHREELDAMKQLLLGLQRRCPTHGHPLSPPQKEEEGEPHSPQPVLFTKEEPPKWFRKLQQKPHSDAARNCKNCKHPSNT